MAYFINISISLGHKQQYVMPCGWYTPKSRKWRPGKRKDVLSVQYTQLLLGDNEGKPQVRKIIPAMASDRGSSGVKLWSRSEQMKGDE